jgi:hypothetical protein
MDVLSFVDQLFQLQNRFCKTGYFDPAAAVVRWRSVFRNMREHSYQRTMVEMGLAGVATQLCITPTSTVHWRIFLPRLGAAAISWWRKYDLPAAVLSAFG